MRIKFKNQTEIKLVTGVYQKETSSENNLYKYCADYYYANYPGVFNAPKEALGEIFQNAIITLWEQIESRIVSVQNDVLIGKDHKPLSGKLTTYFMGIAKNKYFEWARSHPHYDDPETEMGRLIRSQGLAEDDFIDISFEDNADVRLQIIAETLPKIPERCYEILTKFYYEEKDLDRILKEIPSISSKDTLKSRKHKCMENLKQKVQDIYNKYLNH